MEAPTLQEIAVYLLEQAAKDPKGIHRGVALAVLETYGGRDPRSPAPPALVALVESLPSGYTVAE